ncbi:hypothetical protein T492DRAFT_1140499 [Pavlovales sp. CCMP2436]|nr:hypothetical protein T492DRAFT_1140499 [Pavlovales sp. CCMP2436]
MSASVEKARTVRNEVLARLKAGNSGFPAARELLKAVFDLDPPAARTLAFEIVSLLVLEAEEADDGDAGKSLPPAKGHVASARSGEAKGTSAAMVRGPRHATLCALVLDCALETIRKAPPPPLEIGAPEALSSVVELGRKAPMLFRKLCRFSQVRIDEPPTRAIAIATAEVLFGQSGSAHREAAFLLAEAKASEAEFGEERAHVLLDSLAKQSYWPAARGYSGHRAASSGGSDVFVALVQSSPALQRYLVGSCVSAKEHKRALGYVKQFSLGPATDFEHIYSHLEVSRVIWLVKSGFSDLVHAVLRDGAEAILAHTGMRHGYYITDRDSSWRLTVLEVVLV